MEPRKIAGIARSYYWAAEHMQSKLAALLGPGITKGVDPSSKDPTQVAIVGCNQSTILLWAISTEVALKALYAQESGSDPSHVHRLVSLYERLEPDTRSSLETRFQAIRDPRPLYKGRSNSLEDVLTEHNRDFVDWRYVYESIEGRQNQILDLKPAIEAMLAEFEIRDQHLVNC